MAEAKSNPLIQGGAKDESLTHNDFEIEKKVRKAIENLESLTSKVAKNQIPRSQIIALILD